MYYNNNGDLKDSKLISFILTSTTSTDLRVYDSNYNAINAAIYDNSSNWNDDVVLEATVKGESGAKYNLEYSSWPDGVNILVTSTDLTVLTEGKSSSVLSSSQKKAAFFEFTPKHTGEYEFAPTGVGSEGKLYLYDKDLNLIKDYGTLKNNGTEKLVLDAQKTYYIAFYPGNPYSVYQVSILLKQIYSPQFVDVPKGTYYTDAVTWAVGLGVTTGTSATTFSPNTVCTRAQAVTFLWRAAGSPEPKSSYNPFADVKAGQYYTKAVLWAVENGITTGTGTATFSPNMNCSRSQIVTFLYRSKGEPNVAARNTFVDVPSNAYYAKAVTWAVDNWITNGTSARAFSPNADCTRAQIVTFLHRAAVPTPLASRFDIAFNTLKDYVVKYGSYNSSTGQYYITIPDSSHAYGKWAIDYASFDDMILLSYLVDEVHGWEYFYFNLSIYIYNDGTPFETYTEYDEKSYDADVFAWGLTYIDPATYKKNTSLKYYDYEGESYNKAPLLELTEEYTAYTLEGMKKIFDSYGWGITIEDLGFTAF